MHHIAKQNALFQDQISLRDFKKHTSAPATFSLQDREKQIISIAQDVRKVIDSLSDRAKSKSALYCIDFDVIYSAGHWFEEEQKRQFWSSIVFLSKECPLTCFQGQLWKYLDT